jgi:cation transport ATPase
LREAGVKIVMLTGDNRRTAQAVAARLGLADFVAEVLPQDKHRVVQELQAKGEIVAMAGDGVNDAPALAQANVGIAMGHGTDIAMQSARVVLVKGDLRGIAKARRLSRATMANIRQNLFFAFVYNALGVPIAAGVLFPWLGLLLSPMIASAAMSLSSVSVITHCACGAPSCEASRDDEEGGGQGSVTFGRRGFRRAAPPALSNLLDARTVARARKGIDDCWTVKD